MSTSNQRGRRVSRNNRTLRTFYMGIAAVLVFAIGFVGIFSSMGGFSREVTPVTAPMGRTADGYYYKGNPDAVVKVIEYADYQCPSCAEYDRNLAPLIDRDYVNTGKIQFIYHELPLTNIHRNAQISAEAARCAGDQGVENFWKMHDMIYINQDQWASLNSAQNVFASYAGQLGMDRNALTSCLTNGTHKAPIEAAMQVAMATGVQATPTFEVNGQRVTASELDGAIRAALAAAGQ